MLEPLDLHKQKSADVLSTRTAEREGAFDALMKDSKRAKELKAPRSFVMG